MKLLAQDFWFKNSSIYGTVQKLDAATNTYYTDLEQQETGIRIYGTKEQIDSALDEYLKDSSLYLDEVYNYEVVKKGSYWHFIYGDKADDINKRTSKNLKRYNKMYKEKKVALIFGLR